MTEEIRSVSESVEVRLAKMERDVHFIRQQGTQIIQALGAEQLRAPGSPDGIIQILDKQATAIKDVIERVEKL